MSNTYKKYRVTIYEKFFDKELTGEFIALSEKEAIEAAKDHYAMSLDTEPQEISIINVAVE